MTFDEYWRRLTSANPALKTDGVKVTLTIEQFKKRIQIAYEQGRKDGSIDGGMLNSMFGF